MDATPYPGVDGSQPCSQLDPELFFPIEKVDRITDSPEAIRACRRCPFLHECLAYAITHAVSGIWGGSTEEERISIRRKHGIRPDRTGLTFTDPSVSTREEVIEMDRGGGTGP